GGRAGPALRQVGGIGAPRSMRRTRIIERQSLNEPPAPARPRLPHRPAPLTLASMTPRLRTRLACALPALLALAACARQSAEAVSAAPGTPGFLCGLWHGFIFPVAWLLSLFSVRVAIYAVPNPGGW